jgi:hypothetical protein
MALPTIIYERDGIPIELADPRAWRQAIERGLLNRLTPVTVVRAREVMTAVDVPELTALFDELEAVPPPPAPAPTPIPAPTGIAWAHRMREAVVDYSRLVETRGVKPRQLAAQLDAFPDVRGLRLDAAGALTAIPYSAHDPAVLLLAAGDGDTFAVLPTYDYAASFRFAFWQPVQNPESVRRLFDLEPDDSRELRVEAPAVIRIGGNGQAALIKRGRLRGFQS